jgi:2-oxoglutarate ferredoxin oxidoreductase subunit alpha
MATGHLALGQEQGESSAKQRIVNDFSIIVATVNGSGSQSANSVLLKSIFGMGVPVSGKNLFPSNIAGLPTWYTIRASKDGYVARKREIDVLVALNPETAREDMMSVQHGGAAIYEEYLNLSSYRDDVVCYPVPFDKLTQALCPEAKLRKLVRNMVYVGVVSQLLGIDLGVVEAGLRKQFSKKPKVFELNFGAVETGFEYAKVNFTKQDPYFIERMDQTKGKIIIDGNAACGMGAVFAGVTVVAWYPITPSTSLVEATTDLLKKFRVTPEGKATFAVVQAEDELAAIGMVLGAGDDVHFRAGHLADGRVCGAGLLRRDSRSDFRCAAQRAFNGNAHAHAAVRPAFDGVSFAWRHQARDSAPRVGEGVLRAGLCGVRLGGAAADAGVCAVGFGFGNEQLDVGAVCISRQAIGSRQGADG